MILSHRIALDTTCRQRKYFAQACGTSRLVWNWALEHWNIEYAAGGKPTGRELKKQFNAVKHEIYPWLRDIHRDAHARPFDNLQSAFSSFFKGTTARPTFKKKGKCRDSFYVANDKLRVDGKYVVLPKIGRVRLREELCFSGKIVGAVVSRTADRWFISIQVDVGDYHKTRQADGVVGVDLGLTTTVTVSDGQKLHGPQALRKRLKQLRRASRKHSRKQKGSKNRQKAAKRLAKIHARVANVRNDWLHKTSTKLARENQAIYFEDLAVANMSRNRRLARAISDAGWRELRRQSEYKAVIYGGVFATVSRWLPSSKTCRMCGCVKKTLKLSQRMFRCDSCGHVEDRDLNASHNIRTAGSAGTHACGSEGSGAHPRANPCRDEAGTNPCPLVGTI